MAASPVTSPRVRVTVTSAFLVVAALAATILALRVADRSQRAIGWLLIAMAIAALVMPVVDRLARHMPRGLAVLLTTVGVLAAVVAVTVGLVDDVRTQVDRLQRVLPERAAELEQSDHYGDVSRELDLEQRTRDFVDELPERLAGAGDELGAVRSTVTRGLAVVATAILALFFVLYGRRMVDAAVRQVRDPDRRDMVGRAVASAGSRGLAHARCVLAMSVASAFVAYALAKLAGVPAPTALAVWVLLWSFVPIFGFAVGALPIVVLAGAESAATAALLAAAFAAIQLVETFVVRRWLERRTLRVGPFLVTLAAFGGLELYGLSGALLAMLGVTLAAAAADELAPRADARAEAQPSAGGLGSIPT